jgi:hypothetical protein
VLHWNAGRLELDHHHRPAALSPFNLCRIFAHFFNANQNVRVCQAKRAALWKDQRLAAELLDAELSTAS